MVKTFAVIFGLVFLVVGILGFVPAATPDGMLLNTFHVNWHTTSFTLRRVSSFCSRHAAWDHRECGFKSSASFTPSSLFEASPLTPATRFGSCRIILPTPGSTSRLPWSCFSWASARQGEPLPKFPLVSLAVARLIRLPTAAILLRDRAGFGVLHHSL